MKEARKRRSSTGVYLRKDGRYDWQIVEGRDPVTGNPKRLARGICRTEKEAITARNEALAKLHLGLPVAEDKQTVAEFMNYWLEEHVKGSKAPKTERFYDQMVRLYINPAVGHLQLRKLTAQHVQRFLNERSRSVRSCERRNENGKKQTVELPPLTPQTVNHIRRVLTTALNCACDTHHLIQRNPTRGLQTAKVEAKEPVYLSTDEAEHLLRAASGHYLENIIRLALHTGLRIGEATGLTWADVDVTERKLQVRQQLQRVDSKLILRALKTGSSRRSVMLTGAAVEALEDQRLRQILWRSEAGDTFNEMSLVFTTTEGRPLDPKLIDKHLKTFAKAAKIAKPISFHKLRHTAATHLIANGVPLNVAKEILGHSQISLTANTYAHAVPAAHQAAFDILEKAYSQ